MTVRIFEAQHIHQLEGKINEFLHSNPNKEIVDIKYSDAGAPPKFGARVSALIMFK